MSNTGESSHYSQNLFGSSEHSQSSPLTDQTDFTGYFDDALGGLGGINDLTSSNAPVSGYIDPRYLDKRFVGETGNWAYSTDPGTFNAAVESFPSLAYAATTAENALQSVQDMPSAKLNATPWAPQLQTEPSVGQMFEGPEGSMAERSPAIIATGGPASSPYVLFAHAGAGTSRPSAPIGEGSSLPLQPPSVSGRAENAPAREKVPIDRLQPTHTRSDSSSAGSFTCDVCGLSTKRPEDLKRHRRTRHPTDQEFFRCDKCDYDNDRSDHVLKHCREVHGQQKGLERYSVEFGRPDTKKRDRGPNKHPAKKR